MVEEPMAIDENGEDSVIDFDVGRSFLSDSSTNGFIFTPFSARSPARARAVSRVHW
jgi:hypothetical protein